MTTNSRLWDEFSLHADRWKRDTVFLSDVNKITSHPSYLHIVSMGREVLPFILKDLQQHGGLWFTALEKITKHEIRPTKAGDIKSLSRLWVLWGQLQGYLEEE